MQEKPFESAEILIVDDQPRNLDALEAMLDPLGCTIVRAVSADEALLALLRHEFAAIVLDIRMPGMNGIELATLIKQRKRSQHVPILFLTAHLVNEEDILQGYGVGAVDYLSKPINAEVLRSKIGVFVELFRKTRALSHLNETLQTEIAEREHAQEALRQANQELERRVQERTAALVRAHQGVRENEERMRMAMEIAQIAAWEWDLGTGEMTWSTDPEALFRFPAGSFGRDRRLLRALHPDDRLRMEAAVQRAVATGAYEGDYRIVKPDGTVVWITDRGQVIPGDEGAALRMVGVSRDVTAQREAEQERERLLHQARLSRDEAVRQSRLKDEFLATLSHELRTPMNAVLGWLDILVSGKPVREPASVLGIVQRNAQIQAKLIEDLLDMNRLMAGNVRLDIAPIDLCALLRGTVQALQPTADAKRVQVVESIDDAQAETTGDARRLQQVLWNVVHNAIKFTPQGGRVQIRLWRDADRVQIAISDTGRGISQTFLPYVFERFRQEDSSPSREAFGLGLGLSIAKHLVELHGGSISASSEGEGHGATFLIDLPIAPMSAALAAQGNGTALVRPGAEPLSN